MDITFFTNEYPPNVYGGAGVHVEYLTRELAQLDDRAHDINVFSFGDQDRAEDNLRIRGVDPGVPFPVADTRHTKLMDALVRDLAMSSQVDNTDIVHCHTWYSHFAGCLTRQLADARLVLTTHSLEPHRPWKEEQLGTGYHATTWVEQTAYENADGVVAVSKAMARDVQELYDVPTDRIQVIPNGIDLNQYQRRLNPEVLDKYGIDPGRPFVLFVGRITRQKGILHLVNAIKQFKPGTQVVLCAGAPDTDEIAREMNERVEEARASGDHDIIWIDKMLPKDEVITLYSHAAIFVCPSVYEPFGIINLEAMACETPVVATEVGGIPEVIIPEQTGVLVSFEQEKGETAAPADPEQLSTDLAKAVNRLLNNPELRAKMSENARAHVEQTFGWNRIAEQTLNFYKTLA